MAEQDAASKTEEASPKKLEEARKKGDVAKSQDIAPLMALTAAFAVVAMGGGFLSRRMAEDMLPFIAHPDQISLQGTGGAQVLKMAAAAAGPPLLAVVLAAALAGVMGNLMQHGFLWTTEKLTPDFSRISPGKAFGRMFGLDGWAQFIKSLLKIATVGAVAWWILAPRFGDFAAIALMSPAAILPATIEIVKALFIAVIVFMAVTAGADFLWQRFRFLDRMKMTKDELKQEHKNTEGDPHIKAKLRQMRIERSRRRMMQAVPTATVVIMNPTHYAVALFYDSSGSGAPKCVAKGLDSLALKIRAVAEEAGVPVVEDPPLARTLYAAIDVDEEIPPAHYQAVAKVIGFIMNRARRGPGARPLAAGAV